MMTRRTSTLFLAVLLILTACHSRKSGVIAGSIVPPAPGIRITAARDGMAVAEATADPRNGSFRLSLDPGTYDVSISVSTSPFPISFPGVIVEPGRTKSLGTIELPATAGHASIKGRIESGGAAARVVLLQDGVERASATTDPSGSYTLKELPAGAYVVRVQAEHYADDSRPVSVSDGAVSEVNMRLLYRSPLGGADWEHGMLRATGIGVPPPTAPTPTVRRELARRAAIADAERNLLLALQTVEIGPEHTVGGAADQKSFTQQFGGFLRGYRVVADRDLDDGKVEVEIEIPLTGPGGLSSYLPMN